MGVFFDTDKNQQPSSDDWSPEPLPLLVRTSSSPYPLEALPPALRDAVVEVQRFVKAPVAMVATSALAAISAATQTHCNVRRADKLEGPTGLFFLTIADSGERKSTCDAHFTVAIREFEAEQVEAAKPLTKAFEATKASWSAREAGIKDHIKSLSKQGKDSKAQQTELAALYETKPEPPKVQRILRGDDTPENLAWVLFKEWPTAAILSSEAGLILGSHGMGSESVMRNLGLLNILWDGGRHSIGRRTTESFEISNARLTIALQVQEATFRSFFERTNALARGMGFLARFLIAWPTSTQGSRLFAEAPQAWPAVEVFNRYMAQILRIPVSLTESDILAPRTLDFSPDAKQAWIAFHDSVERDLASGCALHDVRDVASKSADNVARLAAILQVFESGRLEEISLVAVTCASKIVGWHLSESRRFFSELALPDDLANAARLDEWLLRRVATHQSPVIPFKDVQQFGPSRVRDGKVLEGALRVLEEHGRARLCRAGRESRRKIIAVNFKLAIPILSGEAYD